MRRSTDAILTSHAGSLPRPDELIELNRARQSGEDEAFDEAGFQRELTDAVRDVVARQVAVGVSVPGDGEFGKAMGHKVNYGAWWSYSFSRLGGLDPDGPALFEMPPVRSKPGEVHLTSFADRRDRLNFQAAYNDPTSGVSPGRGGITWPRCVGPVSYIGHDAIAADIANFKAALAAANVSEGFMTSVGPASAARVANEHYKTEEEFIWACADAMREEYQAIIDAGLVLQIDDPFVAEAWDQINPEPTVEDYQRFTMTAVDALNHALRGFPTDRIRFHLCWGSWHGPHSTDIEMRDIVDVMLAIDAGAVLLRGRERPPRARVGRVAGQEAARGQGHPAGDREPRDQRARASRARRPAHRPLRRAGRPDQRDRVDRLRAGRPHPSRHRMGEARDARPRRAARDEAALEVIPRRNLGTAVDSG